MADDQAMSGEPEEIFEAVENIVVSALSQQDRFARNAGVHMTPEKAVYLRSGHVPEEPDSRVVTQTILAALAPLDPPPMKAKLYVSRCGFCGATEGTVDPDEVCPESTEDNMHPHQFGVFEPVAAPVEGDLEPLPDGKFRDLSHLYAEESVESNFPDPPELETLERCETTESPRLPRDRCTCDDETDLMGPCQTWELGSNGRCVYCDHTRECHSSAWLVVETTKCVCGTMQNGRPIVVSTCPVHGDLAPVEGEPVALGYVDTFRKAFVGSLPSDPGMARRYIAVYTHPSEGEGAREALTAETSDRRRKWYNAPVLP